MSSYFKDFNDVFDGKYDFASKAPSREPAGVSSAPSPLDEQRQKRQEAKNSYMQVLSATPPLPETSKSDSNDILANAILSLGPALAGMAFGGSSGAAGAMAGTTQGNSIIMQNMKDKKEAAQKLKEYREAVRKASLEQARFDYEDSKDGLKFERGLESENRKDERAQQSQERSDRRFQMGLDQRNEQFNQRQNGEAAESRDFKRQEQQQALQTPYGTANSIDDAKKLKEAYESKQNFDNKIDQMIALREKHKGGAILNRNDVARGEQLSKDLLLEYKNMAKLGVLSASDENIINTIIPSDPLQFNSPLAAMSGQDPTLHRLKSFKGDSDKDFQTKVMTRTREGLSQTKKNPTVETKEWKGVIYKKIGDEWVPTK